MGCRKGRKQHKSEPIHHRFCHNIQRCGRRREAPTIRAGRIAMRTDGLQAGSSATWGSFPLPAVFACHSGPNKFCLVEHTWGCVSLSSVGLSCIGIEHRGIRNVAAI